MLITKHTKAEEILILTTQDMKHFDKKQKFKFRKRNKQRACDTKKKMSL